ncbi:MAG TPA: pyridoxal phosphate-dependent aminotransferase, partial [Nitrososphaerales archaeon]|nr:pyridoxal phosphate-dependent aminotransferase [Nitrososphaerales archaeon]
LEMINLVLQKMSMGEDVVSLAIGEPSFDTPKEIVEAASRSMAEGNTHYVSSYGLPEVREAIVAKVKRKNGMNAAVGNTIFSTTKLSIYAALLAVSGKKFEALVPDPGYFYREPVTIAGGVPVSYRLADDFGLDVDEIRRSTTKDTKVIMVNTPSNPSGRVFGRRELRELYDFCHDRGIFIISDEAYEDIVYDVQHVSPGSFEPVPETVISLFSLSKSYSMTGWRAGYIVAHEKIVNLVNNLLENTMSCFPPFIQKASAFALENCENAIIEFRDELRARREIMQRRIRGIGAFAPNRIDGTFYAFPGFSGRGSSRELSKKMLQEYGVAVLPGTSFGETAQNHFRLSFSSSKEVIEEGMDKVEAFFKKQAS